MTALVIFMFKVYVTSADLGSPSKMWDNLASVVKIDPVSNNARGSYLTMYSRNGLMFGLTNIIGNFGTVFVDQSYWQSAIAATPSASWKGYLLGGLCWFSIPFSLATAMGLASVALSLPVTAAEASQGLVPPAVAQHMMGSGGSLLMLIMLFMAVTSTGAAEQIAVSSLIAYDVYRTYINKAATGKQIITISRVAIVAFGIFSGVLGIILQEIGIGLGWLYLFMGVMIGSAVVPVAMSIAWSKCSALGAVTGAISGLVLALTSWLAYGAADGGVNIDNLGRDEIMLTGNLVAILSSGFICTAISLVRPDNCDWSSTRAIALIEADEHATLSQETEDELEKATKIISAWGVGLTIVLILIWPIMTLPFKSFSKSYFTFWVIIALVWGVMAFLALTILPVWESRSALIRVVTCNRASKVAGKELVDEAVE
jgi:urea-proton symporter